MNFFSRLQGLPEREKKIILWAVIIIIGIPLFTFYIKDFRQKIKNFNAEDLKKELKIPELQKELGEIPKVEMPNLGMPGISDEELKKIENEAQKNTGSYQ